LRSIAERTTAIYTILNAKDVDPRPVSEEEKKSAALTGVSQAALAAPEGSFQN
jgi:hypothetical protein